MVKLEISAITDEFSPDFRKVCEYFAQQDVHYVELRNLMEGNILTIDDEKIDQVKDILNENGLKVSCISGATLKCTPPSVNPNPTEKNNMSRNWKYNYAHIDRAIDVACKLDAPYIRCFGYAGHFDVKPIGEWENWDIYSDWSKIVSEMKEKAHKKGKMFVCENDSGFNKSLSQIERIGKDHASDGFGMLYDMANVANKYHENGVLTEEWLSRLGKYIQYIHAKGTRKRFWGIYHTSYINGKGDICRWPQVIEHFRNMKASDFITPAPNPLFLSIETHFGKNPRWKISVKNLENLKALLE